MHVLLSAWCFAHKEVAHLHTNCTASWQGRTGKTLKAFSEGIENDRDVAALKAEVEKFAGSFPMPGQ
jgi:glycine hydroxymethyltransferase